MLLRWFRVLHCQSLRHVNPHSPSLNINVFRCWGSGVFWSSACSNTLYVKLLILVSSPKPSANWNRGAITWASKVLVAWVSLEAQASGVWSSSWHSPSSIHFHFRFGMPQQLLTTSLCPFVVMLIPGKCLQLIILRYFRSQSSYSLAYHLFNRIHRILAQAT